MARFAPLLLCLALLAGCGEDPSPDPPPESSDKAPDGAPRRPDTAAASGPRQWEVGRTVFESDAEFVGRWSTSSVVDDMWIVLRDDGRYRYSGTKAKFSPGDALGGQPPWTRAHTGAWTVKDGVLGLKPDENATSLPFEFDRSEGSLNLRVIGRAPSGATWIVFFQEATD